MRLLLMLPVLAIGMVDGATCPAEEYAKYYDIFPMVSECSDATGYGFFPPRAYPTDQQVAKMCETPACHNFMQLLARKHPADCDITEGGAAVNFKRIVDNFEPTCEKLHPQPRPCPKSEYAKYYDLFPAVSRCSEATGYGFFPPRAYPTDQQVATMCKTPACVNFIKLLASKHPSDCDITEGGAAVNFKRIVDNFEPTCKKLHQ